MPEKRQQAAALQTRTRVSKTDEPLRERWRDTFARNMAWSWRSCWSGRRRLRWGRRLRRLFFLNWRSGWKAPRQIAQEIANGLGRVDGIAKVEVRVAVFECVFRPRGILGGSKRGNGEETEENSTQGAEDAEKNRKIIVEHTSIQSEQGGAHRARTKCSAGDTMVRILRHTGNRVQIQNYIETRACRWRCGDWPAAMEKVTPVW